MLKHHLLLLCIAAGTAVASSSDSKRNSTASMDALGKVEIEEGVAASYSPPPGAACWICLDGGPDAKGRPIVRDCSCHGDNTGFAHISCLVKYAERKSNEIIDKGEYPREPWQKCPHCRQSYQRQVSLDMARAYLSFVGRKYPGRDLYKMGGLEMIVDAIPNDLQFRRNPELRKEGKRAASEIIAVITDTVRELNGLKKLIKTGAGMEEESTQPAIDQTNSVLQGTGPHESLKNRLKFAYMALGQLSEEDKTVDGYEMALRCYEQLRDIFKSEYDEVEATRMEALMDEVKAKLAGGKEPYNEENEDKMLKIMRGEYEDAVRRYGEHSPDTLTSGVYFSKALANSGKDSFECERLLNKLAAISRRAHGPNHPITKDIEMGLGLCRQREVVLLTRGGMPTYQVLRANYDEGTYVIKGPIAEWEREPHKEKTVTVAIGGFKYPNDVVIAPGMPVICHGLKNKAHLNGKIGDVRSFDGKTLLYVVRFEDKSLKSAFVKQENLRIVFDLPDE